MDYQQFFIELKECYLQHGLEFKFDLKSVKSTYIPKIYNKANFNYKSYRDTSCEAVSLKNKIAYSKKTNINVKTNMPHFTPSATLKEFVYKLAFMLAEKIGKLPDHLHSRMVLSTDKSIYKDLYFKLIERI